VPEFHRLPKHQTWCLYFIGRLGQVARERFWCPAAQFYSLAHRLYMRIAVISDVHGNLTALEAVLVDLKETSPDAVYSGGDLATHGHRPSEVIDRIRELQWPGVYGNTDEMLWRPECYAHVVEQAPKLRPLLQVLFDILAPATRQLIGNERLEWMRELPRIWRTQSIALVHATPDDLWKAPMPDAPDDELRDAYERLDAPLVAYGHIHRGFIRPVDHLIVANAGSVGLPYDGDRRASYLLIDNGVPSLRRVEYDVEEEIRSLVASSYPQAIWLAKMLRTGRFIWPRPISLRD
jgi:putative phosphoesterase